MVVAVSIAPGVVDYLVIGVAMRASAAPTEGEEPDAEQAENRDGESNQQDQV